MIDGPYKGCDPDTSTSDIPQLRADVSASPPTHSKSISERIGNYRIIRELGRGGMGTVYEAEQESPRRIVALKVIRAGIVDARLLRRFEFETQFLGKLDHPGIATIFEAGVFDTGAGPQPFFAMEMVRGLALNDYANKKQLSTRQRLELLISVADAVQHAHQKGVIHRDLKPVNILVTDDGQVKILDFGVARATETDFQTSTLQTEIGQLVGTIPYMSPEQTSGDAGQLDTRSDVYALGVVAYELLVGRLPYDISNKLIHEAVRIIREDEPTPLSSINNVFRGDIEIIVSTALQKTKTRRYQSASDFAGDIDRFLNNEPIVARPTSTWYKLNKFLKRNKVLVSGIAAVLIVAVIGFVVTMAFALRTNAALREQKCATAKANLVIAGETHDTGFASQTGLAALDTLIKYGRSDDPDIGFAYFVLGDLYESRRMGRTNDISRDPERAIEFYWKAVDSALAALDTVGDVVLLNGMEILPHKYTAGPMHVSALLAESVNRLIVLLREKEQLEEFADKIHSSLKEGLASATDQEGTDRLRSTLERSTSE